MYTTGESAQDELLREAQKAGNQICKLRDGEHFFVKARRGYSHPESTRILYAQAFDALQSAGKLKLILKNCDLELYEVIDLDKNVTSVAQAQQLLLQGAQQSGQLFKVHSACGEFVQVGSQTMNETDDERVTFLRALADLIRHGQIRFVSDSKEVTRYGLGKSRYALTEGSRYFQLDSAPGVDHDSPIEIPLEVQPDSLDSCQACGLNNTECPAKVMPNHAGPKCRGCA